jgi:glycosyltransferase involved in cell wall biosynthesis
MVSVQPGLVTTIIPVFNRPAMLAEAVGSVLAQTYRPVELIVIDDGSTDSTATAADDLAARHAEVRVIHQKNRGAGPARESGRQVALGEFIQHLDSDDLLLPRKFELQVAGLRAHPDAGASYGWTRVNGAISKRTGERIETMFPAMLQSRWWDTPSPLWRASLIHETGPWLDLRNEEDWEYDARIASRGVRLHYVPEWVCEVRMHDEPRLSRHGLAPEVLRDRAVAHVRIFEHAKRANIGADEPEMQHFARELFLLARQSGAAGLRNESRMLFELARQASTNANSLQFRAYRAAAAILGWSNAGKLACLTDRLR